MFYQQYSSTCNVSSQNVCKTTKLYNGPDGAAAAAAGIRVSTLGRLALRIRGGVIGLSTGPFTNLKQAITYIVNDIGQSKPKSWAVLVTAILLETFAATLSKRARDAANPSLFLCAISLNLLRYVNLE